MPRPLEFKENHHPIQKIPVTFLPFSFDHCERTMKMLMYHSLELNKYDKQQPSVLFLLTKSEKNIVQGTKFR